MSQDDTENLQEISMQIILGAGNVRSDIQEALKYIETFEFEKAEAQLTQAKEHMSVAHSAQTNAIQKEASGEVLPYSTLFTHAQDHLMTAMSELNITKNLLKISKVFDQRFQKLEKN
ncbi:PTS lactose/cellobiose transporter subunit IIA [Tetragenococcus halophilus]|uniref:PTS lactose/cellobiose transporter subunit IIA n=1 Tax=Tetragenococcus halophilus TaxID=51669 RepID=A0AB35HRX3_TETHA|nr:PTS lactose/cellobiose transporter subunit IIA [Tetragenococcus halophilus]MCO8298709.1 PTS lactose/cellobiose transporter subunit IIA [Tetragenococcus halophilus]